MKKLAIALSILGTVLIAQTSLTGSAYAGTIMSPKKVIFPRLDVLLVHCCHGHSVHPYDSYCCHPPGAYVARAAVTGAAAYGVYRGVKHAHKRHHVKHHKRPAKRRR